MMRALLLGAFATSALASECGKDVSAIACRGLSEQADFHVDNLDGDDNTIKTTAKLVINQAIQYVGDTPWNRNLWSAAAPWGQTGNGCTFHDESPNGDTTISNPIGAEYTCTSAPSQDVCAGTNANDGKAEREVEFLMSLQHMVSKLDSNARYSLYFQRVLENPIQGNNVLLKWIAENACKIYVDVEFECTGGNCVEVTTIVCASFAGIKVDNKGSVSIECKVPNGFAISNTQPTNTGGNINAGATLKESAQANVLVGGTTDEAVWDGSSPTVTGTMALSVAGATRTLSTSVDTVAELDEAETFAGTLTATAWVRQGTGSPAGTGSQGWNLVEQTLHAAKYNLTRASNAIKTFNMPVSVLFYSDVSAALLATQADIEAKFSTPAIQAPFLAKTEVKYGAIDQHVHAYFSVVARVDSSSAQFTDLRVSKIAHTVQGVTPSQDAVDTIAANFCNQVGPTTYFSGNGGNAAWPRAVLACEGLMNANNAGAAIPLATAVTAGDTLVASLKWKLKNNAVAGKAALLQDAADEVQSVEVSLTIQLGGGETTITTAGGSDGSADPTVTYIIIAVCIVAAGLILAVVVVAFMCMRNRSNEAIVSMSPQKCTVAAVYDISQPKKADAMDV